MWNMKFKKALHLRFRHTSQMSYLINHARIKQRSLVITLLDLKNSFGKVHHSLITEVLNYHHMPEEIQKLISNCHHKVVCSSIYFGGPGRFARRSSHSILYSTPLLDLSNQNNSSSLDTVTIIS